MPPLELHADTLIDQESSSRDEEVVGSTADAENDVVELQEILRSNKDIVDDPSSQKLSQDEIETLKREATDSGKAIITNLLQSHSAIDQKTAFSLGKYIARKKKKYLKRFCVLPLDVSLLTAWMSNDRDSSKTLELRNEILSLIVCWANIHLCSDLQSDASTWSGNWLVVDDTGGLVVAAMAESMGVLRPNEKVSNIPNGDSASATSPQNPGSSSENVEGGHSVASRSPKYLVPSMSASSNTITAIHSNSQPNLALLRYFSFDVNDPSQDHPLYTRLKTISWLQLLDPHADPVYEEPETVPPDILCSWKSSKRSSYWRKRRRWERVRSVIDNTRAGGFDGLIVASSMHPTSIVRHVVPLLAGGAQVVVYSPHIEPLAELADLYSIGRRTAFLNTPEEQKKAPCEDFPVDPTLLLSPTVQTVRARRWQVLPSRTHPLMTEKGGAEGYVFHSTRILPVEGKVAARGQGAKRRKVEDTRELHLSQVLAEGDVATELQLVGPGTEDM